MSAKVIDLPVVAAPARVPRRPAGRRAATPRVINELRPAVRQFLADIGQQLGKQGFEVVPIERGLSTWNITGNSTITVEPVNLSAFTGRRVAEVIRVRTGITVDGLLRPKARLRALLNTQATLGALLADPDTGQPVVVSRFTTHGTDDSLDFFSWLAVCALHRHADWLRSLRANDQQEPQAAEAPAASKWGPDDLEQACNLLSSWGLHPQRSGTAVCAEIPWAQGAVSALLGDETMLLTLSSDNPHPVVGAGLFCKLELPVRFRKQRLAGLVDALNRFEWNAIDGPPLLGAWASHISTGRVAYVSFLPNYLWGQNCTPAFTNWLYQRAQIVREALINGRL